MSSSGIILALSLLLVMTLCQCLLLLMHSSSRTRSLASWITSYRWGCYGGMGLALKIRTGCCRILGCPSRPPLNSCCVGEELSSDLRQIHLRILHGERAVDVVNGLHGIAPGLPRNSRILFAEKPLSPFPTWPRPAWQAIERKEAAKPLSSLSPEQGTGIALHGVDNGQVCQGGRSPPRAASHVQDAFQLLRPVTSHLAKKGRLLVKLREPRLGHSGLRELERQLRAPAVCLPAACERLPGVPAHSRAGPGRKKTRKTLPLKIEKKRCVETDKSSLHFTLSAASGAGRRMLASAGKALGLGASSRFAPRVGFRPGAEPARLILFSLFSAPHGQDALESKRSPHRHLSACKAPKWPKRPLSFSWRIKNAAMAAEEGLAPLRSGTGL